MNNLIGWSKFAANRHCEGGDYSFSCLSNEAVAQLVADNWENRIPGQGETDLSRKVVVPIKDVASFRCASVLIHEGTEVESKVVRRQEGEDLFIKSFTDQHSEEVRFVNIVCYSAEALSENGGERATDCDWEIVCVIASPVEKEPMTPLAMARNFLEKPGGTKSTYSAEEFAESIYYWSQRITAK